MTAFVLQDENAMYHECGFSCDNAYLLCLENERFFITDSRYVFEAEECVKNTKVILGDRRDLVLSVVELLEKHKVKSLKFDPDSWSVSAYERLKKALHVNFEASPNFSQQNRIIKTKDELDILRKAAKNGEKAFDEFAYFIREKGIGLNEKELFFEAEKIFKNKGEQGLSFLPIVAINENAAKPHALPTDKVLKEGDLLLLDAGVLYKRYCSDRTRTAEVGSDFNFGKVQTFKDKKRQKIYDIVLKAQEESIKSVKIGAKACDIDRAARKVIIDAGYEKYFFHSTGHGVGVDIHELPIIGQRSEQIIEENMVFSIEPGIYLPNEFGIRIEDVVVATNKGAEIL